MKNYYKILNINEKASKEEIKEAYRRLSKLTHPDNDGTNGDLHDKFQDINEANQVLSNYHRRVEYDRDRRRDERERWQSIQKTALIIVVGLIVSYLVIVFFYEPQKQLVEETEEQNRGIIASSTVNEPNNLAHIGTLLNKDTIATLASNKQKDNEKFIALTKSSTTSTHKTADNKELSEKEMREIVNSVYKERIKNNFSNCIKIRKTDSSNIDNWLMFTIYLKEKGFVISGREIVNSEIEGAEIDMSGECITLTIGHFPLNNFRPF